MFSVGQCWVCGPTWKVYLQDTQVTTTACRQLESEQTRDQQVRGLCVREGWVNGDSGDGDKTDVKVWM